MGISYVHVLRPRREAPFIGRACFAQTLTPETRVRASPLAIARHFDDADGSWIMMLNLVTRERAILPAALEPSLRRLGESFHTVGALCDGAPDGFDAAFAETLAMLNGKGLLVVAEAPAYDEPTPAAGAAPIGRRLPMAPDAPAAGCSSARR